MIPPDPHGGRSESESDSEGRHFRVRLGGFLRFKFQLQPVRAGSRTLGRPGRPVTGSSGPGRFGPALGLLWTGRPRAGRYWFSAGLGQRTRMRGLVCQAGTACLRVGRGCIRNAARKRISAEVISGYHIISDKVTESDLLFGGSAVLLQRIGHAGHLRSRVRPLGLEVSTLWTWDGAGPSAGTEPEPRVYQRDVGAGC